MRHGLKFFLLPVIGTVLAMSAIAQTPQTRPPIYQVSRTAAPVKIDGNLDDAWTYAARIELVVNADGSKPHYLTECRILYDNKYLYFFFYSEDKNIWATMKDRDSRLWEEEVVEVFLMPDPAKKNYIELEVNPLGAMLDIYLLNIRKPLPYESWNSAGLKWAARLIGTVDGKPDDDAWICEIAFPLEDAATAANFPPKPGDTWRMNLNRVEVKPTPALWSWSPTGKDDFHLPEKFGKLVFR